MHEIISLEGKRKTCASSAKVDGNNAFNDVHSVVLHQNWVIFIIFTSRKGKSMAETILVDSDRDNFGKYSTKMSDLIGIYVKRKEYVNGSVSYHHQSNEIFLWRASENMWCIGSRDRIGTNYCDCFSLSQSNSNKSPVFSSEWKVLGPRSLHGHVWHPAAIYVVAINNKKIESESKELEVKGTQTDMSNLKVSEIQCLNHDQILYRSLYIPV